MYRAVAFFRREHSSIQLQHECHQIRVRPRREPEFNIFAFIDAFRGYLELVGLGDVQLLKFSSRSVLCHFVKI